MELSKIYQMQEDIVIAVDNINMTIESGEYIAICGQSGAGKSTLMHLLGGLDKPSSGKVYIEGASLYELDEKQRTIFRRRKIGFVFQAFNLIPFLTVRENIILPLGLDGRRTDVPFLDDIMDLLHISDKKDCYPQQLSGGQQQRAAIARALITKPSIIIADEPTGNLDNGSSEDVMRLLRKSCETYKQTLLVVTHNEKIAKEAERVIRIVDGKIVQGGVNGCKRSLEFQNYP